MLSQLSVRARQISDRAPGVVRNGLHSFEGNMFYTKVCEDSNFSSYNIDVCINGLIRLICHFDEGSPYHGFQTYRDDLIDVLYDIVVECYDFPAEAGAPSEGSNFG